MFDGSPEAETGAPNACVIEAPVSVTVRPPVGSKVIVNDRSLPAAVKVNPSSTNAVLAALATRSM